LWEEYRDFFVSLNATRWQIISTLIKDARRSLVTASLAGFGRGIGEVGAIMIVGGNIDHATRVLTTAISLETSRGNFNLAMALGIILILLSITINFLIHITVKSKYEQLDDQL
jgi:tungstate transport system permease protein